MPSRPAVHLLDTRTVAARLGVSLRTLERWRRLGVGPTFVKLNGTVRYEPTEVARFLALSRRTRTDAPRGSAGAPA
jgi:predicted site-specific integrase-resolvase